MSSRAWDAYKAPLTNGSSGTRWCWGWDSNPHARGFNPPLYAIGATPAELVVRIELTASRLRSERTAFSTSPAEWMVHPRGLEPRTPANQAGVMLGFTTGGWWDARGSNPP